MLIYLPEQKQKAHTLRKDQGVPENLHTFLTMIFSLTQTLEVPPNIKTSIILVKSSIQWNNQDGEIMTIEYVIDSLLQPFSKNFADDASAFKINERQRRNTLTPLPNFINTPMNTLLLPSQTHFNTSRNTLFTSHKHFSVSTIPCYRHWNTIDVTQTNTIEFWVKTTFTLNCFCPVSWFFNVLYKCILIARSSKMFYRYTHVMKE